MRSIAVSLAACFAVFLVVLGWLIVTGDDRQLPRTQAAATQLQTAQPSPPVQATQPPAQTRFQFPCQSPSGWCVPAAWGPMNVHTILGPTPRRVAGEAVGRTFRYLLESDDPASFLERHGVTHFLLYHSHFGERGRPTVVRVLDTKGRFAWAAGHNGDGRTWVRARRDLARCGPIFYGPTRGRELHRLPRASSAHNAPPCLVERSTVPGRANSATVLR